MEEPRYSDRYRKRTPQSKEAFDTATKFLPGGDTRSVTFHDPYPMVMKRGSGCRIETIDDRTLIDFLNNYTQSVLGHSPPAVVDAICDRLRDGNTFAAPTTEVTDLAKVLVQRVSSIERIRFCNSGTEATMNAIRGAMAHTDRDGVMKIRGGYHGTHDTVEIGISGSGREHSGIPESVEERVITVPFNDIDALKETMETLGQSVACFILEPILGVGGMIPATRAYLQTARDLADDHGVILIFDEVMSFRLAEGGAQERYGVKPDLTTLGKCIGGGLPIGAFGGRADIMEVYHPRHGDVSHSGTFNGNPATMIGGIETLNILDGSRISRLNDLGQHLRQELRSVSSDIAHPVTITGDGSLMQIHFTDTDVTTWSDSTAGRELMQPLFLGLVNEGMFIAPRGMVNLSTPMSDAEISAFVRAFQTVLTEIAAGQ